MSQTIQEIQAKLNTEQCLPRMAFRRDVSIYELVSYVNNITGCYISENYKPIYILVDRCKFFMECHKDSSYKSYYELVTEYINQLKSEGVF
jgi:hypothetical protein